MGLKDTITEKLKGIGAGISDFLNEQSWFQELRAKWDELEPESRKALQIGMLAISGGTVFFVTFQFASSVSDTRTEFRDKRHMLQLVRTAGSAASSGTQRLPPKAESNPRAHLEELVGSAGIQPTSLKIEQEREGSTTTVLEERWLDAEISHVNLRQIVQLAVQAENGSQPIKIRRLEISAHPSDGGKGFLNARFSLSYFNAADEKSQ